MWIRVKWNWKICVCKDTHGLINHGIIWLHRKTGMRPFGGHFSGHFSQEGREIILIFLADKSVYRTLFWGVEDLASHSSKAVSKSAWISGSQKNHWDVISDPIRQAPYWKTGWGCKTQHDSLGKNRQKSCASSISSDSIQWSSAEIGARLKQLPQTTRVKLSLQKNKGVCGGEKERRRIDQFSCALCRIKALLLLYFWYKTWVK